MPVFYQHSSSVSGSISQTYVTFSCHGSLICSANLQLFLSLSLSFMTWTLLKSTGQVFWRIFFNLGSSDAFSWLEKGCGFPGAKSQRWGTLWLCSSSLQEVKFMFSLLNLSCHCDLLWTIECDGIDVMCLGLKRSHTLGILSSSYVYRSELTCCMITDPMEQR